MQLVKEGSDEYTLLLDAGEHITVQSPDGEIKLEHDPLTGHLLIKG
jgi:hypothetical protein